MILMVGMLSWLNHSLFNWFMEFLIRARAMARDFMRPPGMTNNATHHLLMDLADAYGGNDKYDKKGQGEIEEG